MYLVPGIQYHKGGVFCTSTAVTCDEYTQHHRKTKNNKHRATELKTQRRAAPRQFHRSRSYRAKIALHFIREACSHEYCSGSCDRGPVGPPIFPITYTVGWVHAWLFAVLYQQQRNARQAYVYQQRTAGPCGVRESNRMGSNAIEYDM